MSIVISIENIIKRFGKDIIINGLSLDARPGGFFTLLGLSGCGKTALLRMIIGFNSIESGEIKIDGKVINNIPTNERNMGIVFQSYATFPHTSVRDSVIFGLKDHKVFQDQIESQVDETLKVVKTDHLKKRMPSKLSGGQQQCVALIGTIVIHLEVLLMDGPLSNLDVKLRIEMGNAIKRIQQQVGITTIHVTHDQEGAPAVPDHIAIMNDGVIQQVDAPKNVYRRPSNIFVPTFIGLSNTMDGCIKTKDGQTFLHIGDYGVPVENLSRDTDDGQTVKMPIRPEEFVISREGSDDILVVVRSNVFLGIIIHYFMGTVDGGETEVI